MHISDFISTVQKFMPTADVNVDNYGSLVVYTNLMVDSDNNVVPLED